MRPKIARKYHEARVFDTQRRNKSKDFSDDHTESCGRTDGSLEGLRSCRARRDVVVPRVGMLQDPVDSALICGETVSIHVHHEEALNWSFH